MRELSLHETSAGSVRIVRRHVTRLGLNTSHFTGQRTWSDARLIQAAPHARSWSALLAATAIPVEPVVYDLLVSMEDGINRVQVKTTTYYSRGGWQVAVGRRPYSAGNRKGLVPYDPELIDWFFIVDGDLAAAQARPTVRGRRILVLTIAMPVQGEYEPSTAAWVRDQVEMYEKSGGTEGTTLRDTGLAVVIVTNLGAHSGKVRKTPVMKVEHDGTYAMVASKGGAPEHPVWYYNVRANPHVEVQDGPHKQDMIAREVSGDERAEWWRRAVDAFPPYADYQEKTTREIPVFLLEPAAS